MLVHKARGWMSAGVAAALTIGAAPLALAEVSAVPVLHYAASSMKGAVAGDISGNGHDGTIEGGAHAVEGSGVLLDGVDDHIALPDDILTDLSSITVSMEVKVDSAQSGAYMLWALGNTDEQGVGNGYLFATGNQYRAAIALGNWSTEQGMTSGSDLQRESWKTLTYTLDDSTDTSVLYLDGREVARNTGVTATPSQIGNGSTTANYIGRSVYKADRTLKGAVRDFRVYDKALSPSDVAELVPSDAELVARDRAELSLGDLSGVTENLNLPLVGPNSSAITWSSSDETVIASDGSVMRPPAGSPSATVTLTASLRLGEITDQKTFTATVLPLPSRDEVAQADLDGISIPNFDDVRGNITLPSVGAGGSEIVWSASPAGVISTETVDGKPAGVVTRGLVDQVVTLTASVPETPASREIQVTVKAAPVGLDTDYSAGYLWTHFAVSDGYERIFLGHSPDGLHWEKLNDNQPVLSNLAGDLGVRDPHLVRAPEGDKYWLIGTDLHAEGGGPGGSGWDQLNASQNLVVWESNDLVEWSEQEIVFAGFDQAGNVWAPEAIYNDATGEYYVYWSARDRSHNETPDWALRVYLTKTRDFVNFTTPEVWLSLNDIGDGLPGPNIIDTTIAEEDGIYYRFSTSDWHTVVDTASSLDGPWTTVIDRGEAEAHGLRASMEGLTVYQLGDGRWVVMGDQSGYYAHVAESLASLQFTQLAPGEGEDQYSFDKVFRHGSVLQLSKAEEARLLEAYGSSPVTPVDPEAPQAGPIAQYPFDDGTMQDVVGEADLTGHGTAAVADEPTKGKALRVDGTNGGFASFPTGMFDGRSTMTVSMDVKSDKDSGAFFTFAFGQDSTNYYFFRARGESIRSAITQASWQNESAVTGAVSTVDWHHYDLVFDENKMTVYVDGMKLGENAELSTTVADLGDQLEAYLGKSFYSGDTYFAGWYDNISIYNRALTAQEVLTNAGNIGALSEITLRESDVLKAAPIVDPASRTVTFPVKPGTDLTALTPEFLAVTGVLATPASGTTIDMSTPSTVTLSAAGEESVSWVFDAIEMKSPILPGLNADPNVFAFGDTYYIYATSDGYPGWGGNEFYVWKSKDLVNWTRSERPFLVLDGDEGNVPWATGNAWAPTIIERDGKFYFYFSGHNAELGRKTIGVAVADNPEGPFEAQPKAMILNNEAVTSGQAIDPAAFHDPVSGKYYLLWGNGGPESGPVIAELADDMVSINPGTYRRIEGLTDFREGLFLNYREGTYHLTWSIDDTGSQNYRVGYATSTSIEGPWTYRGVILEKKPELGILATGHSSILNVPGTDEWYIVYHRFAIPDGDGNHRETTIDRLTIGPDGFFEKVDPTLESVDPMPIPGEPRCQLTVVTAGTKTVGAPTNLWGTAADCGGQIVVAEVLVNGEWEVVGQSVVEADGRYVVPLGSPVARAGTFTLRVRVAGQTSAETSLTRIPSSTFALAPVKLTGDRAFAWGWATPGATVRTQVHIDGRGWVTSQSRVADQEGWYAVPLTYGADTAGTYNWRVQISHGHGEVETLASLKQERRPRPTATSAGVVPATWAANVWGRAKNAPEARVWTEVRLSNGAWARSQVGVTDTQGGYVLLLTYGRGARGTWEWRVGVEDPQLGRVYSDPFTLTRY